MEKSIFPSVLSICYVHNINKDYIHINLKQNNFSTELSVASSNDGKQTRAGIQKGILDDLPHLTGSIIQDAAIIDQHLQDQGYQECHSMEQMKRGIAFH